MAIEILWDTVQDAEAAQHVREGLRVVRTAIVKGLTSITSSSSAALLHAIGLLSSDISDQLAFGSEHPNVEDAILVYRVARGIPNTKGTMCRVWAHYETPGSGGLPIEEFTIEDSGQLVSEPTMVFPGTLKPLRCSTTSTAPDYENANGAPEKNRPITINYPRNWRSIVMSGLFINRPPVALLNAGNTVNDAQWQGRAKGYWRCDPPNVLFSTRDGLYLVRVGTLSKGTQPGDDWSTYEIPRKEDGEFALPKESKLIELRDQEYAVGVRNDTDGIWKGGVYPMSNFAALFGANLIG